MQQAQGENIIEHSLFYEREEFSCNRVIISLGLCQGGPHDLAKFRVPMIHRFMTSYHTEKSPFLIKYQYAIYYGKYLNIFISLFVESYHNIVHMIQGGSHDLANDITSGCRVAAMFWREAPRWTPDAIWFSRCFYPQANGIMYLECRDCWEGIWPAIEANVMIKQRRFSIVLTINIMQLRGISWRVLRCFRTSVVNVLWLLRPLI